MSNVNTSKKDSISMNVSFGVKKNYYPPSGSDIAHNFQISSSFKEAKKIHTAMLIASRISMAR